MVSADEGQPNKVVIRLTLAPSSGDASTHTNQLQAGSNASEMQSNAPVPNAADVPSSGLNTDNYPMSNKPGIPNLWPASRNGVQWCGFDEKSNISSRKKTTTATDPTSLPQSDFPELELGGQSGQASPDKPNDQVGSESELDGSEGIASTDDAETALELDGIEMVSPLAEPASRAATAAQGEKSKSVEKIVRSSKNPLPLRSSEEATPSENDNDAKDDECPGSPDEDIAAQQPQLDDLPLEQDEHPYDAPAARSTKGNGKSRAITDVTVEDERLRDRINTVLIHYLTHPENVSKRGPWALMHAALPFGVETNVIAGNREVNALGWMCYNGVCAKQRMFQPTKQGFRTNVGAGVQGHEGQFLAILAQSSVQADYPIMIGNRRYTIADLAKYEMATCREKTELTFKLIGLSHYLDPNQQWRDNRGRVWNLEKMVAEELAQPIIGEACGGTHRLMGLSFSLIKHQQAGLPITGHWKRSEVFLNDFVNYAMSLQNADGSFSTEWFAGRGDAPDMERKIQTTGHILEWLVYTLPDEHLRSPRIRKSIEFVVDTLAKDLNYNWPIGPRGHALRALALYNQRVFGAEAGKMRAFVATSPTARKQR